MELQEVHLHTEQEEVVLEVLEKENLQLTLIQPLLKMELHPLQLQLKVIPFQLVEEDHRVQVVLMREQQQVLIQQL